MKGHSMLVIAAASLGCLVAPAASADDTPDSATRCVQLSRVRSTDVVDDRSLLFFMRDGKIYLNYLPRNCPTLGRERRFMYRVNLNQLCDVDTITVIQDTGFGLQQGATCRLGPFDEISAVEARNMKMGPHRPLVETERVAPVPQDEQNAAGASAAGDASDAAAGDAGAATERASASESEAAATDGAADDSSKRRGRRDGKRRRR